MFWINKKKQIEAIVSKAVGPAPWYWNTFPNIQSRSVDYKWQFTGTTGEHQYLVTLGFGNDDKVLMVLNAYARALNIGPDWVGVCFSEGNSLYIMCFDLRELTPFSLKDLPAGFKESKHKYYTLKNPVSQILINQSLEAGEHNVVVPKEFKMMDEIIMVDSYKGCEGLHYAVYLIHPQTETVRVMPQRWFTCDAGFDIGYQWITRVTRDPKSRRLVGDGIRIEAFELTEDGCNLARWI